jgi:hypothetical protein
MEQNDSTFDLIKKSLIEKGPVKVDVYQKTESAFNRLKTVLKALETDLTETMSKVDKRVAIKFSERGAFELEFKISDDILIFSMHTDIFTFPEAHPVLKNSYLSANKTRGYCGIISVYNFLTDSLKFNRVNDMGVLIARIFVNHDNHFFVEGKKQLGILFNDFETDELNDVRLRDIAETSVLFSLNFDIITPPFDQVKMISVQELIEKNLAGVISTGKRLGFKFQSDSDISG